jgi:hypothetical protein
MKACAAARVRRATVILVALAATAALGASAHAGRSGSWTQITHAHNGAKANLGLARGRDGTLHVLWAGPARGPYKSILDTRVSPAGVAVGAQPVVSGWDTVQPPAAATGADGSIHVLVSGQKVLANTDPYAGLNEVVGPGSWRLGGHAFGTFQLTVPSNADVGAAVLKTGELVSAWRSATTLLVQAGVDPSTQPQNITPPGLAESPAIGVDQGSGEAVVAYRGVANGANVFRRVFPSLGAPQTMPGAKTQAPTIAARAGGGIFSAYAVNGTSVRLLRFSGPAKAVPVPKGTRVLVAGLAAGTDGRLWVFYGNEQQTFVTRTSKAVSGFEPVQILKSPAGAVQYFRLEGEGSAGPLDLFADVTVDGQTRDGSYQTHVFPALSLRVAKAGRRLTVRVVDAGDPVAGARVTGLPGGAKATDAKGSVVVTLPAGRKGSFALTATKAGYVPAKGTSS